MVADPTQPWRIPLSSLCTEPSEVPPLTPEERESVDAQLRAIQLHRAQAMVSSRDYLIFGGRRG